MKFLCLHGYGTNNQIFKLQTAALRYELTNHEEHEFEFVQGVLPVTKPAELGTISNFKEGYLGYFDPEAPESGNAALDQLDAYISSHGPFQGVIAFSQGAQLAATYIAHKTLQGATQPAFGCAILFSPLGVYDPREWVAGGRIRKVDPAADGFVLRIPTLVVWGKQDSKWKEEAKGVSKLCVPGTSYTYEHEGGHEIPGIGATDALGPVAKLAKRCIMLSSEE